MDLNQPKKADLSELAAAMEKTYPGPQQGPMAVSGIGTSAPSDEFRRNARVHIRSWRLKADRLEHLLDALPAKLDFESDQALCHMLARED